MDNSSFFFTIDVFRANSKQLSARGQSCRAGLDGFSIVFLLKGADLLFFFKREQKKSYFYNGRAIQALTPPPPSSLIAGGNFFLAILFLKSSFYFVMAGPLNFFFRLSLVKKSFNIESDKKSSSCHNRGVYHFPLS